MVTSRDEPPMIMAIRMTMGHWVAQCISVACELKIPDLLAEGPCTAEQVAAAAGTHPDATLRLLQALASLAVVAQTQDGLFEATPLSEQFRQDIPSLGPYARFVTGPESHRAWGELLHAVRTGQTAFDHVYGQQIFDYFAEHPDSGWIFDEGMTSFNTAVADEIVDTYDFSPFQTIVDLGGGQGLLLAAILRRNPRARGVLFDRPQVAELAEQVLETAGLADRCSIVGGDFFRSVPEGRDAYVLKVVIHDWDDDRAQSILLNCREAMGPDARLLLVERVISERPQHTFVDQRAALMDLNMLILTGGRERTEAEFTKLFESAGFTLQRVFPTPGGLSVIEAAPTV
jgi:cyclopropane fatty-acyl-phospholipid synthase-like methyltransferase